MIEEQWREIRGYPKYEISNFGRLRLREPSRKYPAGWVLRGTIDKSNRRIHGLFNDNGVRRLRVSRLVAEAFIPKSQDQNRTLVVHNDGNPLNNHVSNLRWASYKENGADAIKHRTTLRGEKNPNAKLTMNEVIEIRRRYQAGLANHPQLAAQYGITREAISAIVRRVNWSHI